MPINRLFQLWVRRNAVLILGVALCLFFVLAATTPMARLAVKDTSFDSKVGANWGAAEDDQNTPKIGG